MPYNRTTIEAAVKKKLNDITTTMQEKFKTDPPTAVKPDETNALIAAAVVEAVDELVKNASVVIDAGTAITGAGLASPAGPVTGVLTTTAPLTGKIT